MEPGVSAFAGGLLSGLTSGMKTYSGVCTFNPGKPRVLGGATIVPLTCASPLCAKALIDTTMTTSAVIIKNKLLFIYLSCSLELGCGRRCRLRRSWLSTDRNAERG